MTKCASSPGWRGSAEPAGSIPGQGTCLVAGQVPGRGRVRDNRTLVFLPLFLSPLPSSKNKKKSFKK